MYDAKKRDQFIELRAQGNSFASISAEIGVSKTALIEWSHVTSEEVGNLRTIHEEALREKLHVTKTHRLQLLSARLEAIQREIETRPLTDVSTDKLYGLMFKIVDELRNQDQPVMLARSQNSPDVDFTVTKTWEG